MGNDADILAKYGATDTGKDDEILSKYGAPKGKDYDILSKYGAVATGQPATTVAPAINKAEDEFFNSSGVVTNPISHAQFIQNAEGTTATERLGIDIAAREHSPAPYIKAALDQKLVAPETVKGVLENTIPALRIAETIPRVGSAIEGASEAISNQTNISNAALLAGTALLPESRILHGALNAGFTYEGIKGLTQEWDNIKTITDPSERAKAEGALLANAGFIALGAHGLAKGIHEGLPDKVTPEQRATAETQLYDSLKARELAQRTEAAGAPLTAQALREAPTLSPAQAEPPTPTLGTGQQPAGGTSKVETFTGEHPVFGHGTYNEPLTGEVMAVPLGDGSEQLYYNGKATDRVRRKNADGTWDYDFAKTSEESHPNWAPPEHTAADTRLIEDENGNLVTPRSQSSPAPAETNAASGENTAETKTAGEAAPLEIDALVKHLKDNHGGDFDERGIRKYFGAENGIEQPRGDYGVANRVDEARAARGEITDIEKGTGSSPEAIIQRGRDLLGQGADPHAIVENFQRTKQASANDFAVVRAHGEAIAQAAKQAADFHGIDSPEYKAAAKLDSDWQQNAVQPMKTEASESFRGMQGETDIDTGTFHGLARAVREVTGEDLTTPQIKKATKIAADVSKADADVEATKPKLQAEINNIGEKVEPHIRLLADKLKNFFKSQADDALAEIRKRRAEGRMFTGIDPTEMIPYAKYGAAKIFEKGISGAEMTADWASEMGAEIGDFIKPHLQQIWDAAQKFMDGGIKRFVGEKDSEKAVKQFVKSQTPKPTPDLPSQRASFGDYESGKPMSTGQLKDLWQRAKTEYIDKGNTSQIDIAHKLATDFGIPVKDVLKGLEQSRTVKRVADDVWQKQRQARILKQSAKRWVADSQKTWLSKVIPTTAKTMFSLKVMGHGAVAMGTHAPLVAYTNPLIFAENFGRMYKMLTSLKYYESQIYDLQRRPNYNVAQRAGLVNDPTKMEDFNDPKLAQFAPKLTEFMRSNLAKVGADKLVGMGTRGYTVLKTVRQDLFDNHWDRLAESEQTPQMAQAIADTVNHITGVVKAGSAPGANLALFAPKLLMSRAAVLVGDPARAINSLTKMSNMTPAEKWFATNQIKQAAKIFAVSQSLLIANQMFNNYLGDKKKLNGVPEALGGAGYNPMDSDFMKYHVAGMNFAWGGPFMNMGRLPLRLIQIGKGDGGKSKFLIYPDESMSHEVFKFIRSQESPFASPIVSLVTKADYAGRPLPQIPGYGPPPPVPKRLAAQGVKPYTWTEFVSETLLSIPLEEAAKEVFHYGMGLSETQKAAMMKAFVTTTIMGATGGRLTDDWKKDAVPAKQPAASKSRGRVIIHQ